MEKFILPLTYINECKNTNMYFLITLITSYVDCTNLIENQYTNPGLLGNNSHVYPSYNFSNVQSYNEGDVAKTTTQRILTDISSFEQKIENGTFGEIKPDSKKSSYSNVKTQKQKRSVNNSNTLEQKSTTEEAKLQTCKNNALNTLIIEFFEHTNKLFFQNYLKKIKTIGEFLSNFEDSDDPREERIQLSDSKMQKKDIEVIILNLDKTYLDNLNAQINEFLNHKEENNSDKKEITACENFKNCNINFNCDDVTDKLTEKIVKFTNAYADRIIADIKANRFKKQVHITINKELQKIINAYLQQTQTSQASSTTLNSITVSDKNLLRKQTRKLLNKIVDLFSSLTLNVGIGDHTVPNTISPLENKNTISESEIITEISPETSITTTPVNNYEISAKTQKTNRKKTSTRNPVTQSIVPSSTTSATEYGVTSNKTLVNKGKKTPTRKPATNRNVSLSTTPRTKYIMSSNTTLPTENEMYSTTPLPTENEVPSTTPLTTENEMSFNTTLPTENEVVSNTTLPTENEMSFNTTLATENEVVSTTSAGTENEMSFNTTLPTENEMYSTTTLATEHEVVSNTTLPTENEVPSNTTLATEHEAPSTTPQATEHEVVSNTTLPTENEVPSNTTLATEHEAPSTTPQATENEVTSNTTLPTENEMYSTTPLPTENEVLSTTSAGTQNEMYSGKILVNKRKKTSTKSTVTNRNVSLSTTPSAIDHEVPSTKKIESQTMFSGHYNAFNNTHATSTAQTNNEQKTNTKTITWSLFPTIFIAVFNRVRSSLYNN